VEEGVSPLPLSDTIPTSRGNVARPAAAERGDLDATVLAKRFGLPRHCRSFTMSGTPAPWAPKRILVSMALGLAIPTPAAAVNTLDESNTFVCTRTNAD
jgi:hypothetical protein